VSKDEDAMIKAQAAQSEANQDKDRAEEKLRKKRGTVNGSMTH